MNNVGMNNRSLVARLIELRLLFSSIREPRIGAESPIINCSIFIIHFFCPF